MSFGAVKALDGVTLHVMPGECVGLVGHNGAGKSTIVSVINGGLTPHEGSVTSDGERLERYGINVARARGVRCVFQELSLCPNLSIVENARIMHRDSRWLRLAEARRKNHREEPRHRFPRPWHRQQLEPWEISRSPSGRWSRSPWPFPTPALRARLVILDEPTSSLDASLARQMLDYVRRFVVAGGSVIFISHILHEILETSDRIVVMKDGRVVAERPAHGFDHHGARGGHGHRCEGRDRGSDSAREQSAAPLILSHQAAGLSFMARKGEIIGLAGLAGHGQTELLLALHAAQSGNWLPAA